MSQRDAFLSQFITEKNLQLIAIAGTHGKTTTTAMAVWLFMQLGIPISYSVGAKLSFGDMGHYDPNSQYFVYEADEFDRNFLSFHPSLSLITGIDWDHPDIYPTRGDYEAAFRLFLKQSTQCLLWESDSTRLQLTPQATHTVIADDDPTMAHIILPGVVNRRDAWQVVQSLHLLLGTPIHELLGHINAFPGLARRFEALRPQLYSDYAHTPPKIRGALQLAEEVAGTKVVVVYEGLHNTRQHFIREELIHLFDHVKQLYIVPTYLAREDPNLALLSPEDLKNIVSSTTKMHTETALLNDDLQHALQRHLDHGDLVLCLSAGGGSSLDEWLRHTFL